MKYTGPVRFILKGDFNLAQRYTSRSRLLLQQAMDRMGPDKAYWNRTLPDGTQITVSSLGGVKQVWIDVVGQTTSSQECQKGFLATIDGYGNGLVRQEDAYSVLLQDEEISGYEAGKQSWIGGDKLLSWEHSEFRYLSMVDPVNDAIYYCGKLYARAPGNISGACLFENFLIVKVGKSFYYTDFIESSPYGEDDPGWVLMTTVADSDYEDMLFHVSKDGSTGYLRSVRSINIYESVVSISLADGVPSISVGAKDTLFITPAPFYGSETPSTLTNIPSEYTSSCTGTSGELEQYYAYVDVIINPAYTGYNCDTTPRATDIQISGVMKYPGYVPSGGSGVARYARITPPQGTYTAGYVRDFYDICVECPRSILIEGGHDDTPKLYQTTYIGTGSKVVDRDFGLDGGERTLEFLPFRDTVADVGKGHYRYSILDEGEVTGNLDCRDDVVAAVNELANSLQFLLSPEGPGGCPNPLTAGAGGSTVIPTEGTYPTNHRAGSYEYNVHDEEEEGWTREISMRTMFANRQITILNTFTQSIDKTVTDIIRVLKFEDVVQYGYWNWDHWDDLYRKETGCSYHVYESNTETVRDDVYETVTPYYYGVGTGKIFLDYDLRSGIALILEINIIATSPTEMEGTTRIYWDTPTGQTEIISVEEILSDIFSSYTYWTHPSAHRYIIYPYAKELGYNPWVGITLNKSDIIVRKDETVTYAKGTLLGVDFEMIKSYSTGAGNAISTESLDEERSITKLAAI